MLKDISALLVGGAAVLYVLGYTVHLAYFRVLGIETVGQPLDYIRFAADYSASIIASLPLLFLAAADYLPLLIRFPFFWITLYSLAMIALFVTWRISATREKKSATAKKERYLIFVALNAFTIVTLAFLLRMEFDVAKVRHVLETIDPADVQQLQNQLANPEVQKWENKDLFDLKKKNVARVYSKYAAAHRDTPGFHHWNEWFNPTAAPGNYNRRQTTYLAFILLNAVLFIGTIWQLIWVRRSREPQNGTSKAASRWLRLKNFWRLLVTVALTFGIVTQVFILPYVYATLGRSFVYPIVRLKLVSEPHPNSESTVTAPNNTAEKSPHRSTDTWTHGVYLMSESDSEVVVYDRLNFFQIKHVPKTRVLAVSQLFSASPFESCDANEIIPCETLWVPENTSTSDF